MKPKLTVTHIEEDGTTVEIELSTEFLSFYKKETGHSHVTKKGVTRFLNNLIKTYQVREYCS